MNTLREMVRSRQASDSPREVSTAMASGPARALRINAWNGEKWVLPWGYFYSAHLQGPADRERLVLRIAHHEVVVDGVRLGLLLPMIADLELGHLRDLPEKFQIDGDQDSAYISRVVVRPFSDVNHPEAGAT